MGAKKNQKSGNAKAKKAEAIATPTVKKEKVVNNDPATMPMSRLRDEVGIPNSQKLPKSKIGLINGVQYDKARQAAIALWDNGNGMSVAEITRACNIAGLPVTVQTIGSYTIYAAKVKENKGIRNITKYARTGNYSAMCLSTKFELDRKVINSILRDNEIEVPTKAEIDKRKKDADAAKKALADAKAAEKEKAKAERAKARAEAKAQKAKAKAESKNDKETAEVSTDE
jgi:hypothetical protein